METNTLLPETETHTHPAATAPSATSNSPSPRETYAPLPQADQTFEPPRASYFAQSDVATPRDSYAAVPSSNNNSNQYLGEGEKNLGGATEDRSADRKRASILKRPIIWVGALVALTVVVLAIALPVALVKKHGTTSSATVATPSSSPISGNGTSNPSSPSGAVTGGDGSVITMENGVNFTYSNKFGGFWVDDPNDPFNNNAQANSWTPPLNTSWKWGTDKIYGVNLGGFVVLEPFITPSIFQKYPEAVDEWTLSTLMAADTANGGLNQIEEHYSTFITEQDIAEIAGAGLNWVRLPIPFWAIETWEGEPFLERVSWKYILKVLGWARKYGLRVNIDLHTIPGSQNGYNHSGRLGQINFLNGVMGVANAQRALSYIRTITEFITQPEWADVIPMFGIVNEALLQQIGRAQLSAFYLEAHNMIRNITGVGEGNGPYIGIHDGFQGISSWAGFFPGSDRIILDTHPYFAFDGQPNESPIDTGTGADAGGVWPAQACNAWGKGMNASLNNFGVTVAGEWSNGFNDCGLYVRGVNISAAYGGDCDEWSNSTDWDDNTKAGIQAFALATMDAQQNWFFWTWKVGNSSAGIVEAPLWSYSLGLQNGWMPLDPRDSIGACAAAGVVGTQFDGTFKSWQTGGAGAGTIAASVTASFGQWPPPTLNGLLTPTPATRLPAYTATGTIVTLPPSTLTASATHSIDIGNGWFNTADTRGGVTSIQGCSYPDAWSASGSPVPSLCASQTVVLATPTPF